MVARGEGFSALLGKKSFPRFFEKSNFFINIKQGKIIMLMSLSELPVGASAEVVGFSAAMRGSKKFADVGLVQGAMLSMQSHAPLGGLLRIKLLGCSLALHRVDGNNIVVKVN